MDLKKRAARVYRDIGVNANVDTDMIEQALKQVREETIDECFSKIADCWQLQSKVPNCQCPPHIIKKEIRELKGKAS